MPLQSEFYVGDFSKGSLVDVKKLQYICNRLKKVHTDILCVCVCVAGAFKRLLYRRYNGRANTDKLI